MMESQSCDVEEVLIARAREGMTIKQQMWVLI